MQFPDDGIDENEGLELDEAADDFADAERRDPFVDRCVLGAECCCPHVDHGSDECFTAEMAEQFHEP